LDVLRAVAINLTSLNAQTAVRQNLGFTMDAHTAADAHTPANRQVDDHHSDAQVLRPESTLAKTTSRRSLRKSINPSGILERIPRPETCPAPARS